MRKTPKNQVAQYCLHLYNPLCVQGLPEETAHWKIHFIFIDISLTSTEGHTNDHRSLAYLSYSERPDLRNSRLGYAFCGVNIQTSRFR